MIDKYHKKFFNSRNMYLGRLLDTTDRVLSSKNLMIQRLHRLLDRVELDRPFLFKDKVKTVINFELAHVRERSIRMRSQSSDSSSSSTSKEEAIKGNKGAIGFSHADMHHMLEHQKVLRYKMNQT